MENKRQSKKIRLDSYFYFTICRDNYKRLKEYKQKISLILEGKSEAEKLKVFNLQKEMAECAASVVIFAAFFFRSTDL